MSRVPAACSCCDQLATSRGIGKPPRRRTIPSHASGQYVAVDRDVSEAVQDRDIGEGFPEGTGWDITGYLPCSPPVIAQDGREGHTVGAAARCARRMHAPLGGGAPSAPTIRTVSRSAPSASSVILSKRILLTPLLGDVPLNSARMTLPACAWTTYARDRSTALLTHLRTFMGSRALICDRSR